MQTASSALSASQPSQEPNFSSTEGAWLKGRKWGQGPTTDYCECSSTCNTQLLQDQMVSAFRENAPPQRLRAFVLESHLPNICPKTGCESNKATVEPIVLMAKQSNSPISIPVHSDLTEISIRIRIRRSATTFLTHCDLAVQYTTN